MLCHGRITGVFTFCYYCVQMNAGIGPQDPQRLTFRYHSLCNTFLPILELFFEFFFIRMKGIDGGYKLSELLFGRGGSADAIVNVCIWQFAAFPYI